MIHDLSKNTNISDLITTKEHFKDFLKEVKITFSNRQYLIPAAFFLSYLGYRLLWFMPKFLDEPLNYTNVGHPPTFIYQHTTTVANTYIFVFIGSLIWLAYRIFLVSRNILKFDFSEDVDRNEISAFFLCLGEINTQLVITVMFTVLLIPNYVYMTKYLIGNIWLLVLIGYGLIVLLIFLGPILNVHHFLDRFKEQKIQRYKKKIIETKKDLEELLFNEPPLDSAELETQLNSLAALNVFIDDEEKISTWPINRNMLLSVTQLLLIPLIVAIIENWYII